MAEVDRSGAGLFRSAALDRVSSPDQLHLAASVVKPAAWMLLAMVAAVTATAVAGSVVITVPVKVNAEGILLSAGGVRDVVAVSGGQVRTVSVALGGRVRAGQVVAELEQPDLRQEIDAAIADERDARDQLDQTERFHARTVPVQSTFRSQQRESLTANIDFTKQRIEWLGDRLKGQEELADKGYASRQSLLQSRVDLGAAGEELSRHTNALQLLTVEENNQRVERERELMTLKLRLASVQRKVELLSSRMNRVVAVVSPYEGVVAELKINPGEVVDRGTPLMTLIPAETDAGSPDGARPPVPLVATLYVSPADGKRIKPGMQVEVQPSTAKREEYGFIVARVTSVSEVPSTQEGMLRTVKNRQIVQTLSAAGAPFEVRAELVDSPKTVSGFLWSTSEGPPTTISGGSPCRAEIVTRSDTILRLIVPAAKRLAQRFV